MNWSDAADALIRVWRETGAIQYGGMGLILAGIGLLVWKYLDSWGKRKS